MNIHKYLTIILMMKKLFANGRKSNKLISRIESQKRNAVSLPALPGGDFDAEEKENSKPWKNTRSTLRRSMKRLRRAKSARKASENKKKINKQEISSPQRVDSIRSKLILL